jgi:hypothetical protein
MAGRFAACFCHKRYRNQNLTPMPIRLFTSGTHASRTGTLSFSNEAVKRIYDRTQAGPGMIPFVLGHPKNNLPIVGWLDKSKIRTYAEGDKVSLGFEREDADLSEESMSIIREHGSNKISVRLENDAIRHIGLVQKAAVEENNAQDFSGEEMTGVFFTQEDILEKKPSDFSKFLTDLKTDLKQFFNPTNMADEKKDKSPENAVDFAAILEQNKQLAATVAALQQTISGFINKSKATADFSADEYKNLTAAQKETAAGIIADLGEEKATALKGLLKELAKPSVVVKNGSIAADFGKTASGSRTADEIVREQLNNLNV